jgi:hypothetical protein
LGSLNAFVRFGSEADVNARKRDVRLPPKSGHAASPLKEFAKCHVLTFRADLLREDSGAETSKPREKPTSKVSLLPWLSSPGKFKIS